MFNKELEMAKEIEKELLSLNAELGIHADTREVAEQYKKAHCSTDQSKSNELSKTVNDIISDTEDVDNGEVYDINTGETTRYVGESTNEFYELLVALNKIVKQMKIYDRENKDFCISSISYCGGEDKIYVNFEEDK